MYASCRSNQACVFASGKMFPLVCLIEAWSLAKDEKTEGLLGS